MLNILFIEQAEDDPNDNLAFHMFERINTGGTPLLPQEIRNAIISGPFREHLRKLNQFDLWRSMFGPLHTRAKDEEMILRFLALVNKDYTEPMTQFLRNFMREYRDANEERLSQFSTQFKETLERIHEAVGPSAFKPHQTDSFSAPYFDAFMVAVESTKHPSAKTIKAAYDKLKKDKDFLNLTKTSTTNAKTLTTRLEMVKETLNA